MLRHLSVMQALRPLAALLVFAFVGQALAQDVVLSPRSIVVNPVPGFDLEVWVDKDPSGRATPSYAVGDPIRISVRSAQDAHVYLFSIAADGEVVQVLPNRFDDDGSNARVRAGVVRTFPPAGARYTFNVAPPNGLAKVIAVASRNPLNVSTLATFRSERDFATSDIGEEAFARALSIIVTPVPRADWVSATALYYVGSAPSVGAYGTLQVDSEPRRGEVYVDRTFVGFTPLTYELRPGNYDVEVVAGGASGSERVQIRPDRTTTVFLSLRPVVQQGTATFTSNPSNAEVYVGGRLIGTTPTGRIPFDSGRYEAEFRRAGFVTERVTFDVRTNQDTRVDVGTLRPVVQEGTATFTSSPSNVEVYISGRFVGITPTNRIALDTGTYEAEFRRAGFVTERVTFSVRTNQDTRVDVGTLRPIVQEGTATFTSTPSGAEVYVNGRLVGTTPTNRLTFDTGTYQAEFRRAGHFVERVNFEVRANQNTTVSRTLRAQTATLQINANVGGARVFIDGREIGVIPSGSGRLTVTDLTEGLREVVLIAPGFQSVVQDVRVTAGQTTSVTMRQVRR